MLDETDMDHREKLLKNVNVNHEDNEYEKGNQPTQQQEIPWSEHTRHVKQTKNEWSCSPNGKKRESKKRKPRSRVNNRC